MARIKPENYFFLHNGKVLKNLHELTEELKHMDEETFAFHVNQEKNDFYNWIKDVIRDANLASKIENEKIREDMLRILSHHNNKKVVSRLKVKKATRKAPKKKAKKKTKKTAKKKKK
jgi:hypothetical protein